MAASRGDRICYKSDGLDLLSDHSWRRFDVHCTSCWRQPLPLPSHLLSYPRLFNLAWVREEEEEEDNDDNEKEEEKKEVEVEAAEGDEK